MGGRTLSIRRKILDDEVVRDQTHVRWLEEPVVDGVDLRVHLDRGVATVRNLIATLDPVIRN